MRILGEEALARLPTVVPGKVTRSQFHDKANFWAGELSLWRGPGSGGVPWASCLCCVYCQEWWHTSGENFCTGLFWYEAVTWCRLSCCFVIKTRLHLGITAVAINSPQEEIRVSKNNSTIFQEAVRCLQPGVSVGKILIQVNHGFFFWRNSTFCTSNWRDWYFQIANNLTQQRDESKEDKPAVLYYKKLPPNIPDCFVMLVNNFI